MSEIDPEFKCPRCESTDIQCTFSATVTYRQMPSGEKQIEQCENDMLDGICCLSCGEEETEEEWGRWETDNE
jgi:hypothetical protein